MISKSTLSSIAGIILCVFVAQPTIALATPSRKITEIREDDKKPAKRARAIASRNNQAVKIYPDLVKRIMHVVAKENDGKQIDFFVFDLEGTLVHHYKMSDGDHQRLTLERGKYVYQVFSGDEETVAGQFEMR